MRLLNETQSGGASHYTVEPENSSDFGQLSEEFRVFVRSLGFEQLSTAVSLGQFQRRVERAFVGRQTQHAILGEVATRLGGASEGTR